MSSVLDLADLAAEQWGLVTTAQARGVGASPQAVARLTNQGALERMTHGVYRVTGAPATPLDSLRAAWLALDPARRAGDRLRDQPPAVVSHRSAAEIHGLGDLEADEFEFTAGVRKQSRRPDVRIHRGQVEPGEWSVVDGLPVTTVLRTVEDLAADRIDGGHLAGVVRDALTRQQVDAAELTTVLRRHAHHYGAPMGDGQALLSRFLREAGISEPIEAAVSLRMDPDQAVTARQFSEQVAALQRALEPMVRISRQITNSSDVTGAAASLKAIVDSPGMRAAASAVEKAQLQAASMAGIQEFVRQHSGIVDPSTRKAMAELAQSPAVRQLAKQSAEVAEMSRLAREVAEGIDTITVPDIVLGEIEKG